MKIFRTDLSDKASNAMKGFGQHALTLCTAALLSGAILGAKPAEAVTVDIFLIAEHTTPASGSGAPFSITAANAFQLSDLNPSNRARVVTPVTNLTFDIDAAMTVNNQVDPFPASDVNDMNEVGAGTSSYANSEISTWDNVNIPGSTPAPENQLDFGRESIVTLNPVAGGFTDLIIAELGGYNPFTLALCPDAACTTSTGIFGGLNSGRTADLLALPQFASSDTGVASEMDQTWLFRFSDPIFDYVRIRERDNRNIFTGARLQTDFIGVGGTTTTGSATIPVPAGLPLLASGLALLGFASRRRRS